MRETALGTHCMSQGFRLALSENKGTDVNSIVASINKSSPGLSPPEALDVFINRVNHSISNDLALDDRYLGASLNIVDGPAVTSAILFEASQAEEMGLSRAIVASLKEKAKEGSSERRQVIDEYQRTQHSTLDKWARYLRNGGPSSWAPQPSEAIATRDMSSGLKLMLVDAVITHNYDAATGKYIKRTNKTLRNYTPYDEGTISRLFAEGNPASNALLKEYVELMASNATNVVKAFKLEDTAEGTWLKFPGGASVSGDNLNLNANALSQLVQDTPWCTKNSAVGQLSGGDFYVFVTEEKNGDPKPRVAIKTTNGRLDEARGILDGQQMEPRMRPVFEAFLQKDILTDGAKWLEGQRFNERVKGFREEILKRPLSFEDFTTMDELKQEAGRYSFMQYGQNGFLERLQEDLDIKIAQDDFVTELKGKVAAHSEDLKSTTEILIANFDGEAVFLNIMRDLALTMMKDGKTIQDIGHATLPVFDVASSVFGNLEQFPNSLMRDLVLVRGGGLYQVESVLASLIEAYGKQKATQLLSAAVLDKTKSLKKIGDVFDPIFLPIPQSLKVVGKSVIIKQGNNTGNIISANRLTIYNNTPDFEIGVVKVTQKVSIEEPIKSFGKLEEVGTINAAYGRWSDLESLGNLTSVFDGNLRLEGSKITSLGNLKYVHERLGVPEAVTTLGKLEEVGDLSVTGSVGRLESLGNLRKAGWISVQLERGSNLKDLGKLEQIQSLDILEGSNSLKSLGPHLKAVDELSIMGNALIPDFGALEEVVGSLNLYSDKPVHSLGKIKKVGRMFASNLASFSSLETVEGDLQVWPSKDLKDTGKLKSVGGHLIVGKNSTKKEMGDEFRITNLESVAGNVTIYSERVRSLGSIQTIGGRLSLGVGAAQNVRSLGALRAESVGSYFIDNSAHYDTNTELLAQVAERQAENMRAEEGIAPPNAKGVPFGNQYVPSVRRQKGASISYQNWSAKPQSKAQRVGHRFNMNHNGFTPLTIDPAQFKIAVQNLHNRLGVMRHPDERTGKVNGYSMTLDGKFFNPFLKVIQESGNSNSLRRQGYGAGTQNIYEFIEDTRGRGYTDRVISAFLKEQGYSSAEIKDAIAVPIDVLGNTLPDGFANVEGGVTVGQALFNEILDKVQKYATAKRLGILLHTQADVRAKAQELLVDADTFKAQGPVVQAEMQIGLDKALNITSANKKFQADFKALRTMLTNVKKGVSEMNKAKAALRMFIRKNLPKSQYTKADVNKLMKAITDATPDTLPAVMQRVTGYVNGFFVRNLNAEIAKIMSTKTTTTQAGRRVGRISVEAQNAMAKLTSKTNPMMANEDMTPDQIEAMIVAQLTEFEALSIKSAPTSDEMTRMEALGIAMQYNQASLHEDTNPHKVESLTQVKTNLRSLIATGRSDFRAAMAIQAQYYSNLVGEAFRGITGEKIDLSPDAAKENENAARESANKQANKSSFNNRVKGSMSGFFNNIDDFWAKHSDLSLLMSRITGVMAENFGGPMQEIVTDRLSFARETFVSNKLKVMALLNSKAKEIWGSEYKTELERNAIPLFSKNLVTDKNTVFLKPKEATALRKEYEKADKKRKGKILNRLKELEIKNLSKNQIYYLYNQYKDPANHPSFEKKFGEEYVDIMDGLTAKLDSKTKEWADWQVNELYPSLYDGYNEVYKRIYHTNMPWNQFYAGRIYREGQEGDMTFDLLEGAGNHQASVGGQSTKMRIKNLRKIASMDGNSVLNSYLEDMEYFSAYAEVMRDMSKVFENENVKNAIIEMAGLNTHTAISDMLKKIANRGIRANESPIMNKIMGMYVTSKLGSSPVIMLKQFTSALAFVDYIGPTTWSSYMAKAMAENPAKVWNEWYNNSPLLILRYENSNIAQVLEGYTQKRAMNTTPFLVQTKILGKELTISQRKALEIQNFMMYMVKQGDKGGIMGGLPNYLYYKDQFMKANPQATEQEAIEHAATKTTRQALSTQQDSGIANKDWYQTAGPGYRFVNLFLSSPKALLRKEMYAVMNLMRKIQGKPSQGTALENMRTFFIYHFAIPMFFAWVTSGLIGLLSDPDDEDEQELAIAAIMGNLNALFVIGDLAVAAKEFIQDKSWAGEFKTLPLFEQAQQVIKDLRSWSKAKTPETEQKYFDKLINHATESVSGVPVTNMRRWMDNIEKLANGNVGNTQEAMLRFLNYSNYVIDGPDKKKPAGMSEIDRLMLERSGGNKKSQQN
jgi:hypothetical protein